MKNLKDILKGLKELEFENLSKPDNIYIKEIVFDSRKIEKDDLFVAHRGLKHDGHLFIEHAIKLGAKVIVCEKNPSKINTSITYVKVKDCKVALAKMASNFYDNPSLKLKLIGITGTNGKTTVATLLYNLFKKAGYKAGLISTNKIHISDQILEATHTTPDSLTINKYLSEMLKAKVTHCFMEVSSHGIHQKRIYGLSFEGGIFTNLSHDHLDYHKTFSEYRNVKKEFFDKLSKNAFALVNTDDKNAMVMLQNTKAKKNTYGLKSVADYKMKILEKRFSGMLIKLNAQEVWVQLIGDFNAYNLLAIYASADLLGLDKIKILRLMSQLKSVEGRFQYKISKKGIITIVDYAHTPNALKNILETVKSVRVGNEKIISIVGCGGNRDKMKRSKMGNIASSLSDQVIFTSDNPRFEEPQSIIDQIEKGVFEDNKKKVLSVMDRKQAIKTACKLAKKGDILMLIGKGHEAYQDIKGEKFYFDDKEVLKETLEELEK